MGSQVIFRTSGPSQTVLEGLLFETLRGFVVPAPVSRHIIIPEDWAANGTDLSRFLSKTKTPKLPPSFPDLKSGTSFNYTQVIQKQKERNTLLAFISICV